jgi:transcription elongation factor Elf1
MIAPLPLGRPKHSAETQRRPKRPNCPHCGCRLLLAERSRFNLTGRIDHVWACDDCGTEFETSIEVQHQAVA